MKDGNKLEELRELVDFLKANGIAEFDMERTDLKVRIKFAGAAGASAADVATILESMDEVVIVLNNQGHIVFINNVFDYYFGMDPKSLIGKFSDEAFAAWPELKAVAVQASVKRDEVHF